MTSVKGNGWLNETEQKRIGVGWSSQCGRPAFLNLSQTFTRSMLELIFKKRAALSKFSVVITKERLDCP